jgi:nitrite reductase/ring-hydroxylating ferredoxin subunit
VLADALLAASTERAYADTGHALDFINKAFECLDLIGWEHATAVLPTVVGQMVDARGAEESTAWRQPDDLVALCDEAESELPDLFRVGQGMHGWSDHLALAHELLGDDPVEIIAALKAAIRAGVSPADLSRSLAYGAALRVARFGNANEHGDWETAHHVFTYANAIDQLLRRIGTTNRDVDQMPVRGVLHGAMALYLTRYLNVPPARIPGDDGEHLDDLPVDVAKIRTALLDAFDRRYVMDAPNKEFALAGSLDELKAKGRFVLHGGHRPILVIYDRGHVFALDNRCPHMGFPLERGSVEDGILTCHWHHARFDLESGCTFDLWADARSYGALSYPLSQCAPRPHPGRRRRAAR